MSPCPGKNAANVPGTGDAGELARKSKSGHPEHDAIYSRAQPKTAEVTERYYYEQKISRNPSSRINTNRLPTGHIEVTIPYDGYRFFTRQACADVAKTIGSRIADADIYALIGHLLFTNYSKTDLSETQQPKLSTHVFSDVRLTLDDAFERRILSPYQSLYFDEVILDEMRVADIIIALTDQGFYVTDLGNTPAGAPEGRFLLAKRLEGPYPMELWLFITGTRYTTERHNLMPGGHTYKSIFETGEIRLFIRGALQKDSRELIHEMNTLQLALRERFERLRIKH